MESYQDGVIIIDLGDGSLKIVSEDNNVYDVIESDDFGLVAGDNVEFIIHHDNKVIVTGKKL